MQINKPLAKTFLVKQARYRNATFVTSPVIEINEMFLKA
jgi:hypothetical protein